MRKLLFVSLGVFVGTSLLSAQLVSVGVMGGIPLNDPTSSGGATKDESPRYVVGASVELKLPANFAIEADALYRRIGNTLSFSSLPAFTIFPGTTGYINRERGNSWEFPLLGKYYFHEHESGWRPFVGTGFAFRTTQFDNTTTQTTIDTTGLSTTSTFAGSFRSNLDVGATVAAGIRLHKGRIALTPEFRYTRWGAADNQLARNDSRFLLGLSF
jgi:hypothetical protein